MKRSLDLATCTLFILAGTAASAVASVTTTATVDEDMLTAALSPSGGLEIDAVTVLNGLSGQIGTYSNFVLPPVTIHDGIVLSSGNVAQMGPIPGATLPEYDPCCPPAEISSQMYPFVDGSTPEFNDYGFTTGTIENFFGSYDVAALRVDFTLDEDSAVKFDFIFGSVEYPYYTSSFTDAFLVFLDGTEPENQITFDANGNPVQVGSSFAGLETTEDQNCAFSDPHGLIHHLTTTTEVLSKGEHFLIFEVADVNDHILDSAAFITQLRTGTGDPGTDPTEDCLGDLNEDGVVDGADITYLLGAWGDDDSGDLSGDDRTDGADITVLLGNWGPCPSDD